MDTTVTIGGEIRTLSPMTFAQLKRVAPLLSGVVDAAPGFNAVDAALAVLAAGWGEETAEVLANKLLVPETNGVIDAVSVWLRNSGLVPAGAAPAGEAQAVS